MLGIVLVVFIFIVFMLKWSNDQKKLPPGPKRIPIFGCIPFITTKNGMLDWTSDEEITKHKIATVQLGIPRLFVINDFDLAKVRFLWSKIRKSSKSLLGAIFQGRVLWKESRALCQRIQI